MSREAALRLQARLPAQYLNGTHPTYWVPDMNDMAAVAVWAANSATQAEASNQAAAAQYALSAALGASAYGIGVDPIYLPRRISLGSAAFVDAPQLMARRVLVVNASYQVLPQDFQGAVLLTTSGTPTITLPPWASMPLLCPQLQGKNRSGSAITLNPSAADTLNGGSAGTGVSVPNGSSYDVTISPTSGAYEARIYA